MILNLEKHEVERLKDLIINRINELRYDLNDEDQENEEEIRKVIREYKLLLNKVGIQIENK